MSPSVCACGPLSGGYGKVYKCTFHNQLSVIKIIQVDTKNNINDIQDAIDEATNLVKMAHPHIVSYTDAFMHRNGDTNSDFVCIVMEYCDKGSLFDLVERQAMTFSLLLYAFRQICMALAYTHSRGVLHCDVKLENIFVVSLPALLRNKKVSRSDYEKRLGRKHIHKVSVSIRLWLSLSLCVCVCVSFSLFLLVIK